MTSFAFAPNKTRTAGETTPDIGGVGPESYNAALCCLRLCRQCSTPLTKRQQRRFCSHACYSASLRLPVEPRFWSHVDKNGPIHPVLGTRCWLWTANCVGRRAKNHPQASQHGQFTYSVNQAQIHVFAHRFAWALTHGPIPSGIQINHHCDVPPCVRPDHLYAGTQADNMRDAARRNRLTVPRSRTLSLFDRLTIYRTPEYRGVGVALAREYGVSKACISVVRSGRFVGCEMEVAR